MIPGPRPMPLLGARGNFLAFATDPVGNLSRLHERYGEMVALARGRSGHVFVFGPRHNRAVLGDPALFGNLDAASAPVRMPPGSSLHRLYAGLTTMNGARHKRVRRLVAPALHQRRVDAYAADVTAVTRHHLAGWHDGDRIDLAAEMRSLTLAVAVRTLLGLEPGRDAHATGQLLQSWTDAVFAVPAMALPLDLPGLPYHRLRVLSERLEAVVRDLIRRRRAAPGGRDVLAALTGGAELTDDELVGQTAFLFMAGHATTASALTWTVLLLALHPAVLHDVADELAGPGTGLPLLDRVIAESLRLLPPVAWWGKVTAAPCELGGHPLPAGTTVVFSPYVTHRLPELWPHPARFDPDRWLGPPPVPYAYLPFSAGGRGCLGAGFAQQEMRLILAALLRRWHPRPVAGTRVDRGGLMVTRPRRNPVVTLVPAGAGGPPPELRGDLLSMLELPGRPATKKK